MTEILKIPILYSKRLFSDNSLLQMVKVKLKSADTEPPSITNWRKQRNKENEQDSTKTDLEQIPKSYRWKGKRTLPGKVILGHPWLISKVQRIGKKSKIRQQRLPGKRNREGTTGNGKTAVTRDEKEKWRRKWHEQNRQQKARMPNQKKRRIKEDKMGKRAKKEQMKETTQHLLGIAKVTCTIQCTSQSSVKGQGQILNGLHKFADVLDSIIVSASPIKKQALGERSIISAKFVPITGKHGEHPQN